MKTDDQPKKGGRRKPARDSDTGRFQEPDPFNDPDTFDSMVKVVRAVRDLEPVLSASVLMWKQLGEAETAQLVATCGIYLAELKATALRHLSADPESLKEAKKLRLEAQRLGNMPLVEQQRMQQLASEWMLSGVTPERLAQARPEVLRSMMKTAMGLGVGLVFDETRQAGPALDGGEPEALT